MGVLDDRAKADWQTITTDKNGWGNDITLTHSDGVQTIVVTGITSKHHIGIDTDGNLMNVKNAHISFSEQLVIDGSFPIRNTEGNVYMENYRATFKDSKGDDITYVIREWFPDEKLGVILCLLGDYKPD